MLCSVKDGLALQILVSDCSAVAVTSHMNTCHSADFTALTGLCVEFRNTYFLTLATPKYVS